MDLSQDCTRSVQIRGMDPGQDCTWSVQTRGMDLGQDCTWPRPHCQYKLEIWIQAKTVHGQYKLEVWIQAKTLHCQYELELLLNDTRQLEMKAFDLTWRTAKLSGFPSYWRSEFPYPACISANQAQEIVNRESTSFNCCATLQWVTCWRLC
ncbi:hypothetical protein RRG08_036222 [Elysia crispata]|uniref:Uncharacterized protein n=1 Tax=Elysia crispata TaxID=231223 RepID=A0AAE0XE76_9GAST|nr:hypothetical protein RRG08_036222 [Elysia crispata]